MDPADPERPPTAEGGASGAEKGKKRDEIASISNDEPSGGTQVETDGLKGGGVEHDDGDGGDASPESASPSSRSSTGGSSRNGRSAVSAAALVGGSASGSETLTEPAGGPHAGPSGTPAPPQASGSADAGLQLQLQPAAQQHAGSVAQRGILRARSNSMQHSHPLPMWVHQTLLQSLRRRRWHCNQGARLPPVTAPNLPRRNSAAVAESRGAGEAMLRCRLSGREG